MVPWMYQNNMMSPLAFLSWIWPLAILDLVLKGFALWRSAKNDQPIWFVVLLVINSLGILPLVYLIAVDKNYVFQDLQKRLRK